MKGLIALHRGGQHMLANISMSSKLGAAYRQWKLLHYPWPCNRPFLAEDFRRACRHSRGHLHAVGGTQKRNLENGIFEVHLPSSSLPCLRLAIEQMFAREGASNQQSLTEATPFGCRVNQPVLHLFLQCRVAFGNYGLVRHFLGSVR